MHLTPVNPSGTRLISSVCGAAENAAELKTSQILLSCALLAFVSPETISHLSESPRVFLPSSSVIPFPILYPLHCACWLWSGAWKSWKDSSIVCHFWTNSHLPSSFTQCLKCTSWRLPTKSFPFFSVYQLRSNKNSLLFLFKTLSYTEEWRTLLTLRVFFSCN